MDFSAEDMFQDVDKALLPLLSKRLAIHAIGAERCAVEVWRMADRQRRLACPGSLFQSQFVEDILPERIKTDLTDEPD